MRADLPACPQCQAGMVDVVTIMPTATEQGLIAYECSKCGYVMSVLQPPLERGAGQLSTTRRKNTA
jgi:hypothetical protein